MATTIDFVPSNVSPFTFQAAMAGVAYTVTVTWNVFRKTGPWYINVFTLAGALVCSRAMVGSPSDSDINLVAGVIPGGSLVYRAATQQLEYA